MSILQVINFFYIQKSLYICIYIYNIGDYMKNMIMKNEIEDFLQNNGFVLAADGFWMKDRTRIFLDFIDEEGQLCVTSFKCYCCEVTDKYLIIYDNLDPYNSESWAEIFRVELKQIKNATVKAEVEL